jgi:hypothetical protein
MTIRTMESYGLRMEDFDSAEEALAALRAAKKRPATLHEIAERLARRGVIYDTGERRGGEIVYGLVPPRAERN